MDKLELEREIDILNVKIENISNKKRALEQRVLELKNVYNSLEYNSLHQVDKNKISNEISMLCDREYDLSCNLCYLDNEIESLEYEYCNLN